MIDEYGPGGVAALASMLHELGWQATRRPSPDAISLHEQQRICCRDGHMSSRPDTDRPRRACSDPDAPAANVPKAAAVVLACARSTRPPLLLTRSALHCLSAERTCPRHARWRRAGERAHRLGISPRVQERRFGGSEHMLRDDILLWQRLRPSDASGGGCPSNTADRAMQSTSTSTSTSPSQRLKPRPVRLTSAARGRNARPPHLPFAYRCTPARLHTCTPLNTTPDPSQHRPRCLDRARCPLPAGVLSGHRQWLPCLHAPRPPLALHYTAHHPSAHPPTRPLHPVSRTLWPVSALSVSHRWTAC